MVRRLDDTRLSVKLALLTAVGLAVAVLVGMRALGFLGSLERAADREKALGGAVASLNFLDHRMSELKADGFSVFVVDDPANLAEEAVGDGATIGETWDAFEREGLPADVLRALDALAEGQRGYAEFVVDFTAAAAADPVATRARWNEVVDRNRALDPLVEGAHGLVAERTAEAATTRPASRRRATCSRASASRSALATPGCRWPSSCSPAWWSPPAPARRWPAASSGRWPAPPRCSTPSPPVTSRAARASPAATSWVGSPPRSTTWPTRSPGSSRPSARRRTTSPARPASSPA
jgi:hypothetical protein